MVFSFEVFDGHIQHDQVHGTVQVPSAKRAKRLLGDSKTLHISRARSKGTAGPHPVTLTSKIYFGFDWLIFI